MRARAVPGHAYLLGGSAMLTMVSIGSTLLRGLDEYTVASWGLAIGSAAAGLYQLNQESRISFAKVKSGFFSVTATLSDFNKKLGDCIEEYGKANCYVA